jgi:putative transposase
MREPYTQMYLHIVWSTHDRHPFVTPEIQPRIYRIIQAECVEMKVSLIAIGGVEDHVHLLVRFPSTISVSKLVKQVKGVSSHFASDWLHHQQPFKWQEGYGAFTISARDLPRLKNYVANQAEHHRTKQLFPNLERCHR